MIDYDIVVDRFDLQSRYYICFRTITWGKVQTPYFRVWIKKVQLPFFSEEVFGIKNLTKIDMPLCKEIKLNKNKDSKFRTCDDRNETVNLVISECSKQALKEYTTRQDGIEPIIYQES